MSWSSEDKQALPRHDDPGRQVVKRGQMNSALEVPVPLLSSAQHDGPGVKGREEQTSCLCGV